MRSSMRFMRFPTRAYTVLMPAGSYTLAVISAMGSPTFRNDGTTVAMVIVGGVVSFKSGLKELAYSEWNHSSALSSWPLTLRAALLIRYTRTIKESVDLMFILSRR